MRISFAFAFVVLAAVPARAEDARACPPSNEHCGKSIADIIAGAGRVQARKTPGPAAPGMACRTYCRPTVAGILYEDGSMRCDTICQ